MKAALSFSCLCLFLMINGCSDFPGLDYKVPLSIVVGGTEDTLRVGIDTITIRAEISQPLKVFARKSIQIPATAKVKIITGFLSLGFENSYGYDFDAENHTFKTIFIHGDREVNKYNNFMQIMPDKCVFEIKCIPMKKGLFFLKSYGGGIEGIGEPVVFNTRLEVPKESHRNFHLLTTSKMGNSVGIGNDVNPPVLFYVK